jgi:1-phosphatidylinositol phosphodiesterase
MVLYLIITILILIVLSLIILSSYNIADEMKISNTKKTIKYKNDDLINKVNILGTHDSLTYKINNYFSPFGKTQYLDLKKQYNLGARYFDLRFKKKNKELLAFHGIINLGMTISEAFDIFLELLKEDDSFIILTIKEEDSPEQIDPDADILKYFVDRKKEDIVIFNSGETIPKIGDIKNKIFFINIIKNETQFGFTAWKYNTVFETYNLKIEDVNDTTIDDKISSISDSLKNKNSNKINIIFFSLQTNIYTSIKYISSEIHKRVKDLELLKNKTGFILIFDYINNIYNYQNKLIDSIILPS